MKNKILLLEGDGVGPEVIAAARRVLTAAEESSSRETVPFFVDGLIGGAAIDKTGEPLPADTVNQLKNVDAVLLGAVGAPQYDALPGAQKPEKGLLELRRQMEVFANLRPAVCYAALAGSSSLKRELVSGLDILIVRELIGGIYFGAPRNIKTEHGVRVATNTMRYDENEIRRIAKVAFVAAQKRGKKLCSVDKANVLEVSMLWREVVSDMARDYPDVELSHLYVDNAAMQLTRRPKQFDVIVTGNLFGDILSDIAAMLTGSIGMLPSASLNKNGGGLYEPVHGSAPDIAGKNIANPVAAILSAAMMCRHSLRRPAAAARIENAVQKTLDDGWRTADIVDEKFNAPVGCEEMTRHIINNLRKS